MAKQIVKKDDTSRIEYVFIQDTSVSTGAGLTGLVYNSASLVAYYVRTQAAATAITLATLAAATSSYSSGGFKEVDATNMPGVYRVDIPNAAFATGVDKVVVMLKGATNMAPVLLEYQLVDYDPESAASAITSNVKKNQALAKYAFLMTDSTNHAPSPGLTVTCTRSIDGGAFGAGTLANVAGVSNGMYVVDFGAADLNGNVIVLRATAAASDDTLVTIVTQP